MWKIVNYDKTSQRHSQQKGLVMTQSSFIRVGVVVKGSTGI